MQIVENNRLEVGIEVLNESIARWTGKGGQHTTIPGLSLFRREEPTGPISGLCDPSICMVTRGAKRVLPLVIAAETFTLLEPGFSLLGGSFSS